MALSYLGTMFAASGFKLPVWLKRHFWKLAGALLVLLCIVGAVWVARDHLNALRDDLARSQREAATLKTSLDSATLAIEQLQAQAAEQKRRFDQLDARNRASRAAIQDLHTRLANLDLRARLHEDPTAAAGDLTDRHRELNRLLEHATGAGVGSDPR